MKLLELVSKIPQPDMMIQVYDNDVSMISYSTIFKLHIELKKLKNNRTKFFNLHPIDYLLKYSNVKYIEVFEKYIAITLEDKIKEI